MDTLIWQHGNRGIETMLQKEKGKLLYKQTHAEVQKPAHPSLTRSPSRQVSLVPGSESPRHSQQQSKAIQCGHEFKKTTVLRHARSTIFATPPYKLATMSNNLPGAEDQHTLTNCKHATLVLHFCLSPNTTFTGKGTHQGAHGNPEGFGRPHGKYVESCWAV